MGRNGDDQSMEIWLRNLSLEHAISNAVDAVRARYRLDEPGFEGRVSIQFRPWQKQGLECVVSDNGTGISENILRDLLVRPLSTRTVLGFEGGAARSTLDNYQACSLLIRGRK